MKDTVNTHAQDVEALLKYANSIIATLREPFLVLDINLRVISANQAFYTAFNTVEKNTIGQMLPDLGDKEWDIPGLLKLLKEIIPEKKVVKDYEVEHIFKKGGERCMILNACLLHVPGNLAGIIAKKTKEEELVLLAIEDITERKRLQTELKESEERFRRAFETSRDGLLLVHKTEGDILNSNDSAQELLGYSHDEFMKMKLWGIGMVKDNKDFHETVSRLERDGVIHYDETPVKTKKGRRIFSEVILVNKAKVIQCNIRDITERKRMEDELALAKEQQYRTLIENLPQKVFLKDISSVYVSCNGNYARDLNIKPGEIAGKTDYEFFPTYLAEKYRADDKRVMESGITENLEEEYVVIDDYLNETKRGVINTVKVPVRNKAGEVTGLFGLFWDITDKKRAEERLRESERKIRALFDQAFQFIGMLTVDGTVIEANRTAMQFAGINEPDCFGKPFWDTPWWTHSKELQDKLRDAITRAAGGETVFLEATHLAADKSVHYIDFSLKPVKDENGKVIFLIPEGRDITERKRAEDELIRYRDHLEELVREKTEEIKESEERFRSIFEKAMDGIILTDTNTRKFVMCNKMMCDMLQRTEEEIKRLGINDIHPEKDLPYVIGEFDKLSRGTMTHTESVPVKRKDGSVFYADIVASPISLSGKKYIMGSFRDITERKKAEEAVAEAIKTKSDFTGMVSHELRTPLAAIKEGVSVVLDKITGDISEEQTKYLSIVKNNVDRLDRLISKVLDFQTLESGKMEYEIEDGDINEVIKAIQSTMMPLARKKGLVFGAELCDDLPRARFDKDKITQVLANLVNNAIKFTEKGGITISTSRGDNVIRVMVRDTGIGIKKENIQKLFQEFTQLQRKVGGTGLGLSICKKIVEAHKGKIWAESEYGKGTAFCFILPITERRE
ncbi:MAG: PAS domain S-box protein [Candidatus Omnitrophota bacterium]